MKKVLILIGLLFCLSAPAWAATWAVIGSPSNSNCSGSSDNVVASVALNTTGGNTVFAAVSDYAAATHTSVTSSLMGSGWSELMAYNEPADNRHTLWYHKNITAGSDTFSATSDSGSSYPSLCVIAFSGGDPTAPYISVINGFQGASASTVQLGSVDPGATTNALIISSLSFNSTAGTGFTLDSSFTSPAIFVDYSGNHYGTGMSYRIETTSAAVNPTWSYTGTLGIAGSNAVFQPNSGGGGGGTVGSRLSLMGVGR